MFLPSEIIAMLAHFRPAFRQPIYEKGIELLGTLLCRGRRTVTEALRAIGKADEPQWSKYHHVLNRARWSGLTVSRLLLQLLVATLVAGRGVVTSAVDETLERRWGPQIRQGGHWCDSCASSKQLQVSTRGRRWLVFALVVECRGTAIRSPYPC
jgi:hypothetical protein